MKTLGWVAWISAGIGVIFLLLAAISFIVGSAIFGQHIINFFHAANSFFLIAIAVNIFLCRCDSKK